MSKTVVRAWGTGLITAFATTLNTMLHRAKTQQYPHQRPALPPRTRGVIALLEENCTSCMLCARECPDWCIYIDSHKETLPAETPGGRERITNVLDRFAIDFSLCMFCGICVEVCPFDALHWSPEFEYAEFDIANLTHEKPRLGQWAATVPAPAALSEQAPPAKVVQQAQQELEKAATAATAAAIEPAAPPRASTAAIEPAAPPTPSSPAGPPSSAEEGEQP